MATSRTVLLELKERLLPDFRQFKDFLRMVLPKSEDDRKLINLFIDMLSEMIDDMETAEELSDLKDWFKLRDMVDDWDIIKGNFVNKYSSEVVNFMTSVNDAYSAGATEGVE